MEHRAKFPFRRRTCSFGGVEKTKSICENSVTPQSSTDISKPGPTKRTRFRRSSFALPSERPAPMNDLVNFADLQKTGAAASHEPTTTGSIVSSPIGSIERLEVSGFSNARGNPDVTHKRVSVATIVPASSQEPSLSSSSSVESFKRLFSSSLLYRPKDSQFSWHNAEAFSSNPLTSELVMKYLAALAIDGNTIGSVPVHQSSTKPVPVVGENIPGLIPLTSPFVASMTMPVQQIRRAHAYVVQSTRPASGLSKSLEQHPLSYSPVVNKVGLSCDSSHYSGLSDTEPWHGWHRQGYFSDNPMADRSFESKRSPLFGPLIDSEFHRSTTSLPIHSPKRSKLKSRGHETDVEGSKFPEITSSSSHSSTFDLSHVYDSLKPGARNSTMFKSSSSLNIELRGPCLTPPSTPNSASSKSSVNHSVAGAHGIQRLRSLLDHLKPHLQDEDSTNYIYLDEESRARRARAQASNVILPVSF